MLKKTGFCFLFLSVACLDGANANIPSSAYVHGYVDNAFDELNVAVVGTEGSYVKTVQQTNGKVSVTTQDFDTVINDTTGASGTKNAPLTVAVKNYVDTQIASSNSDAEDQLIERMSSLDVTDAAVDDQYVTAVSQEDGKISVSRKNFPRANGSTLGVVKAGTNTSISNGAVNVATANGSTLGVVKAGTNISISNGAVNVATATPSTLGVVKVGQIPSGSATSTTYATIWVE